MAQLATPTTSGSAPSVRGEVIDEINDLVKSIGAWMRSHFVTTVAGAGLTPPQALALLELDEPMPMGALAEGLAFDASYITDIADQLEARGLLERRSDPSDRRKKILALTDEGVSVRTEIWENLNSKQGLTTAGLSEDEQRTLRNLLRKVMAALDVISPVSAPPVATPSERP